MEDSKMDEIKTNVPKTFRDRVGVLRYLLVVAAIVAVAAAGYTFLPEAEVSANAGTKAEAADAPEIATQAMIDFAIGALKSSSGYTVYAERGVTDRGNSEIRGAKGDAMRSAAGQKATKGLANGIDAMRQLPCTELKSGALAGRTFKPGVYCVNSAELDGEMVIDGQGSAAGTFIFRVAGTLNAKSGSSIRVENGAQGSNVYFVAENAEIGDNAAFRAHVLASGDIKVGNGTTMTDKVMALGKVELNNSAVLGGGTGSLEICKRQQLPVTAANDLSNQIFHFVVSGVAAGSPGSAGNPLRVPVNSCSSPIDVATGPQTVTELNTGTLITPPTGTFEGNFELISVVNVTPASPSTLGLVNLATRVANITMVEGGVNTQLTLEFTNRRTITGFVEICKRAATGPGPFNPPGADPMSGGDPDVTGYFSYTIEDVYTVNQQNPNIKTLQVFTIPVGQCTGPISVTKGDPAPFPFPVGEVASLAFVSELPRAGAYLESVEVIPANRANGPAVLGTIVGVSPTGADVFIPAPGGGFQDTFIIESASAANETLLIFTNRSNPSRVKVCKVAGPGIPINTLFTFTVTGIGATTATHPQDTIYGPVSRTFDVRAGDPAQGGTCEFVPGLGANAPGYNQYQTFVNGTPVRIYEHGVSVNNTIPQNPGQLRASQVRVFGSTFTSAGVAGWAPNPDLNPGFVVPGATQTRSFTSGDIAAPIPDPGTVSIQVNVPASETIIDVDARVRLNHTWDQDVDINLLHPDSTTIDLSSDNGGTADNYGTGPNSCAGTPTTFDDEAAGPITGGTAPFAGSYQPEQALSAFDGKSMNGNWQFDVTDDEDILSGTVGCVSLDIVSDVTGVARAAVWARASIVEVEFSNFRFNPTVLKVCKKAGTDNLLGVDFDFTVALVSPLIGGAHPGPMFPAWSHNVTVEAGPLGSQEGICAFVNGSALLGGAFNQGSTITITEAAQGSSTVSNVECLSCGPGGLNWPGPPSRVATLSGPNGLVAGINSVIFTNIDAGDVADRAVKFDFDGDEKADAAVWTPSSGNWKWLASGQSNALKTRNFGVNGDKLVAADYDGDK
ncbi:MAG: ice-binding family protein, partial [Pyrinomonadaceae bacterium]